MTPTSSPAAVEAVVIVGAGQAGFQCAATLREAGWSGRVVIVGDEGCAPYNRPPLSKDFLNGVDELPLRPDSFYERYNIELRTADPAVEIDRAGRRVLLASGDRIAYHHLVLATGSEPRRPAVAGADLDGVVVLRSRADAEDLRDRLRQCAALVVIGGGFIGTEVASFAAASCAVTVLEREPRILSRVLGHHVATHAHHLHSTRGVQIVTSAEMTQIIGENGKVSGVELTGGSVIAADIVLYAVGAAPRVHLAEQAGLATAGGIVVDDTLRTADPLISAIGDCAVFPSPFAGGQIRLESVQNAVDQARNVATRIATGTATPYAAVPWFWTHQHEAKVQIVGVALLGDEALVVPGVDENSFSVYRVRDGQVTAVESVNAPKDHRRARKSLARGFLPVEQFLAEDRPAARAMN